MDILYIKYNYHRLPEFRVATAIAEDGGRRFAVKRALDPLACAHIGRVRREHLRFDRLSTGNGFDLPPLRESKESELLCDYVGGPSLDDLLSQAFRRGDRGNFLSLLDEYVRRLATGFKTVARPILSEQAEIQRVFGRSDFPWAPEKPDACMACAVIDLIFDNIIVSDGRWVLVDNEWVFNGCVPVGYVLFRALFEFYELKWNESGLERFFPFQAAAERYGIDERAAAGYREMEDHFQSYVCGSRRSHFNLRYLKQVETIPRLQAQVRSQAEIISRQDIELGDLRIKAGALAEIQASRGYRLLHALCRGIDRLLPPGTRRRRCMAAPLKLLFALSDRPAQRGASGASDSKHDKGARMP